MSERRGHWYLLTGAIIGIAIGLSIAWGLVTPVEYVAPSSLRPDFKDEYRYMIAAAYAANNNLGRARARLDLLTDANAIQALNDQSGRMLANNISPDVVRSITDLARVLQENPAATSAPPPGATPTSPPLPSPTLADENTSPGVSAPAATETPVPGADSTLEPTSTPAPASAFTVAPRPTQPPTFTPGPPFGLVKSTPFCEPGQPGLLQILLQDSSGQPVAGVELVITWAGGEERFFTGLKPELGNGYADFVMTQNVEYVLSLSNGSTRVTGLSAPACAAEDGSSYPGGVHLDFKQP